MRSCCACCVSRTCCPVSAVGAASYCGCICMRLIASCCGALRLKGAQRSAVLIASYCGILRLVAAHCGVLRLKGAQRSAVPSPCSRPPGRASASESPSRLLRLVVAACCGSCCSLLRLMPTPGLPVRVVRVASASSHRSSRIRSPYPGHRIRVTASESPPPSRVRVITSEQPHPLTISGPPHPSHGTRATESESPPPSRRLRAAAGVGVAASGSGRPRPGRDAESDDVRDERYGAR